MKVKARGFTLVELLVVIAIVAVLSMIVMLLINPGELLKRGRDSNRITDLEGIQKAINFVLQDNNNDTSILCDSVSSPCLGRSDDTSTTVRNVNGTGWVKVNLSGDKSLSFVVLPVDPINNSANHYSYFSDGQFYELNAAFESEQYNLRQKRDGGDNNELYEVGTILTLLP